MGLYTAKEVERMMTKREVILQAMSGKILWIQAAEILGISPRSMWRWKTRLEKHGYEGLYDRRKKRPSPKRVPVETVEKVLRLYREKYFDFSVKHFVDKVHEEHDIGLSYTWIKTALQTAGLVAKSPKRGKHRKKRERRPLPGMMLHVDGSTHAWLGGREQQDLIALLDDASNEVYYAQLVAQESTETVMVGLREVVASKGVFCSLYVDRGSHFVYTPKAGEGPDRNHKTQIGRALEQLGINLIPANSPQARGRCERFFGTWQGRLPQELRSRGITTMEEANKFLREYWIGYHNGHFTATPAQEGTAFVKYRGTELEKIFSHQEERVVGNDNTISYERLRLQIQPQAFRFSLARCRCLVCGHLDGTISVYYGPHLVGRYNGRGEGLLESKSRSKKKAA